MAMTFATNLEPDTSLGRSVGSTTKKFKINGYEPEVLVISVTATSSTTATVSDSSITEKHVVLNDTQVAEADISWTTSSGTLSLSSTGAIPEMTLYLGIVK